MKWRYYSGADASCLRVFYLGWGMDPRPFEPFLGACDTLFVWDWTVLEPLEVPSGDRAVELIAWSMGVWAATQTFPKLPLRQAIAVNGTPYPIDNVRGIPEAVFDGTLTTYSEKGLERFRRRMCGGAAAMAAFMEVAPQRTTEDLGAELAALGTAIRDRPEVPFTWTRAIGCIGDKIFPIAAQKAAFPHLIACEGAHWAPQVFETLLQGKLL